MKKGIGLILLFAILTNNIASAKDVLAFPGAEGYGRFAKGARAGSKQEIYHVTNLNDSGTGSLRDAVSQSNRFVVFDVSGVIRLKSVLIFKSNQTIAGQTAPGEGVTLYGNRVSFSGANNLIVRYLRIRTGSGVGSRVDAAGIANGSNMIFDHVSVSWGTDENFSISWDNKGSEPANITIQNSIIGQGLVSHSCGGLIQTNGGVTLYRNLYIDNNTRNPKVKGLNQFVNNVVYGWGVGGAYILGDTEAHSWGVITNNYFIKGPEKSSQGFTRAKTSFQVYQHGNMLDYNVDGVLNGYEAAAADFHRSASDPTTECVTFVDSYDAFDYKAYKLNNVSATPVKHPLIAGETSAAEAYHWITENVGATLPARDDVDEYLIDELTSLGKKGALISKEAQLGLPDAVGYLFSGKKLADTDNDGIPDVWEDAHGLNKQDASDALKPAADGSGYLNIEWYINSIDAPMPYTPNPTDFQATKLGGDYAEFKWVNHAKGAASILIEVSRNDNKHFSTLAKLSPEATSYKAENLLANVDYYYRLKTVKNAVSSDYSGEVKVTVKGNPVAPVVCGKPVPTDKATVKDYARIKLEWTNNTGVLAGDLYYSVYLGKSPDALLLQQKNIRTASYTVPVEPGTTYYWRVDAKNTLGTTEGEVWSFTTGEEPQREKVAYYAFDEETGNKLPNTYRSDDRQEAVAKGFSPVWAQGKMGNAVDFNVENAAFVQQHYAELTLGKESFSIEFWFKSAGGTSKDWYLIHKGSHAKDNYPDATGRWFGLQYNTVGSNNRLTWAIDDDVTKSSVDVVPTSYFNDTWTHVLLVRDVAAKKILIYLNGELAASADDRTGDIGTQENMAIGNCNSAYGNGYQGLMDELSVYEGALTQEEAAGHYLKGSATHIEDTRSEEACKAYPLPFSDALTIELAGETGSIAGVSFTDMTGQVVYQSVAPIENEVLRIDGLSQLPRGYYVCRIQSGRKILNVKVFK